MTTNIRHITESPNFEPRTDSIYVALPGDLTVVAAIRP